MTDLTTLQKLAAAREARGLSWSEMANEIRATDPTLAAECERIGSLANAARGDRHDRETAVVTPMERH